MKHVSVAQFKARFSDILKTVARGGEVAIQYGRSKRVVAKLVPPTPAPKSCRPRRLGLLEGVAHFRSKKSFKMTEEELIVP